MMNEELFDILGGISAPGVDLDLALASRVPLVGQVVYMEVYGPFLRRTLAVVVRVLALDVDVVALDLAGGSEWRRVPRGLVLRVLMRYDAEVPIPLEDGKLLWVFSDDYDSEDVPQGDPEGGPVGSVAGRGRVDGGWVQ